jgi:hypothetical protein
MIVVRLGTIHPLGIVIVPAGSRMVEGFVVLALPCTQGVPDVQVMLVLPELSPRASTTPPLEG